MAQSRQALLSQLVDAVWYEVRGCIVDSRMLDLHAAHGKFTPQGQRDPMPA